MIDGTGEETGLTRSDVMQKKGGDIYLVNSLSTRLMLKDNDMIYVSGGAVFHASPVLGDALEPQLPEESSQAASRPFSFNSAPALTGTFRGVRERHRERTFLPRATAHSLSCDILLTC